MNNRELKKLYKFLSKKYHPLELNPGQRFAVGVYLPTGEDLNDTRRLCAKDSLSRALRQISPMLLKFGWFVSEEINLGDLMTFPNGIRETWTFKISKQGYGAIDDPFYYRKVS